MATNNVIVTKKHAGIPDLIKDKRNGYFVKKGDVSDLKNKLEYLILNKSSLKEIMLTNKELFLANFTFDRFEERIIDIFLK